MGKFILEIKLKNPKETYMKKVGVMIESLFDEQELIYPYHRLREDYEVVLIGSEANKEYESKSGFKLKSDLGSADISAEELEALFIPGGFSPDYMRRTEESKKLVREIHEAGKPIAAICHAGWMLVSSIDVEGIKLTSYPSIKDDMINAGADWIDEETVIDKNIFTGRNPDDLYSLVPKFIEAIG